MTKSCSMCLEVKPFCEFYSRCDGAGRTGLKSRCITCTKLSKSSEKARAYARSYAANYRKTEKRRSYESAWKRKWRKSEAARLYRRNYERDRKLKDPHYRLNKAIGPKLASALKNVGSSKAGASWESIVGYTTLQLKSHLESQFDCHMSWGNYGSYWHIDHIVPKSLFTFSSPHDASFKACWALSNLRPLEAKANLRRNRKDVEDIAEAHRLSVSTK